MYSSILDSHQPFEYKVDRSQPFRIVLSNLNLDGSRFLFWVHILILTKTLSKHCHFPKNFYLKDFLYPHEMDTFNCSAGYFDITVQYNKLTSLKSDKKVHRNKII